MSFVTNRPIPGEVINRWIGKSLNSRINCVAHCSKHRINRLTCYVINLCCDRLKSQPLCELPWTKTDGRFKWWVSGRGGGNGGGIADVGCPVDRWKVLVFMEKCQTVAIFQLRGGGQWMSVEGSDVLGNLRTVLDLLASWGHRWVRDGHCRRRHSWVSGRTGSLNIVGHAK